MFLGMGVKKNVSRQHETKDTRFRGSSKIASAISTTLSDYFGRARLLPIARHLRQPMARR